MIRRMILINSANFDFVDIDLSKDVFFLGDNASGKTTATRAIHYLYNAEGRQLGIPKDKDTFEKYYFPYDDSYIIYVFDDFFITAFKRSGKVQKWFSKQVFDIDRIIHDGKLTDHDRIRAYIKEGSHHRPQTNAEYRKIIYGQDRRFLDFSIASIKNYDAFLEVYNMVFNVDKAIVDMKSIKKAIQKSLQKEDAVLSLDFETYISDMEAFKRDYLFFKKFDKQRENIEKAVGMMARLVSLEETMQELLGKIKFNVAIDKEELPKLALEVEKIDAKLKGFKRRWKHWEKRADQIDERLREKITDYRVRIKELEELSERYSLDQYEEAVRLATQKNRLEKEHNELTIAINELKKEQNSVIESIEIQIAQLEKKIKEDIPLEKRDEFRKRKASEEQLCDSDIIEINTEYEAIFEALEEKKSVWKNALEKEEIKIEALKDRYDLEVEQLSIAYETQQQNNRLEQEKISNEIIDKESLINKLSRQMIQEERKVEDIEAERREKRIQRAKALNEERCFINDEIKKAQNLLHHEPNTLKAFLAQEVDGWEEEIYPVIDKSLLSMSNDVLKPVIDRTDSSTLFGLKVDSSNLKTYPTAEALHDDIMRHKQDRKISLQKAREEDKALQAVFDSQVNQIKLRMDNLQSEMSMEQKYFGELKTKSSELKQAYQQGKERYEMHKEKLKEDFEKQKEKYSREIKEIKQKISMLNKEYKVQENNRKRAIDKRKKDLDFNIDIIKKEMESSMKQAIEEIQKEIQILKKEKQNKTEDERLDELESQRSEVNETLIQCYEAEKFLNEYDEKRHEIDILPQVRLQYQQTEKFLQRVKERMKERIERSQKEAEDLDEVRKQKSEELKKRQDGMDALNHMDVDFEKIDPIEEREVLEELVLLYKEEERSYKDLRIDFKGLISKLSDLEHNAIIDINLNQDKFDEVESMRELEHIQHSLEDLQRFSLISYDNQKRSRHADFTNYLNNIIPQKLGTFNDLEDSFEQQKNKINKHLNRVNFGAITNISLNMERSKGNQNTIAALMRSLSDKITSARTMFEDKESLFFDKPKSIQNIDDIIDTLGKIKKQSEGGAIHIFDTIDLTLSYVENGVHHKDKSHLKNDSSSGGNILLKVAITISILALFANKSKKDTPFFLIVDEISRLQHQNQEKLKQYINEHGFRTLFITPDPVYPDPTTAMYYMFRNSGNEKGGLEIVQMNVI